MDPKVLAEFMLFLLSRQVKIEISKPSSLTRREEMPTSKSGGSVFMQPNLWFLWCKIFPKDNRSNSNITNNINYVHNVEITSLYDFKTSVLQDQMLSFPAGSCRVTLVTWVLPVLLFVSDCSAHWGIQQAQHSYSNDKTSVFQCQASMNDIVQKQCALVFITQAAWVPKNYLE